MQAKKKGIDFSAGKKPFGYFSGRFLTQKQNKKISDGWMKSYKSYVKQLNHYLENIPIDKVTVDDIQIIIDDLPELNPNTGRPYTKSHIDNLIDTARQIFNFAISRKAILENPTKEVILPIIKKGKNSAH